ncbi:PaaI family thioesterase [Novosphingobium sp.]|uniref:PaaI family thioesterase n=1 Tax=Novosphingobium sp. TaxID=1874826 RepID=UPI002B485F90|nr:PaaI family thioesterase [Novosphingobium sp.]HKR91969.1 PaaI family thioesterase [Novosphingobium sp.]
MESTGHFSHVPDPEYPGWHTWQLMDETRFNAHGLGRMLVRREGECSARLRLYKTEVRHSNLQNSVHGGVTLALIDVAMFATIFTVLGVDPVGSVTVDLHSQFLGAGKIGEPLDVISEVMKETHRLVFLRGTVEQDDHLVASYIGTVRKPSKR